MTSQATAGPEELVNTTTIGDQLRPSSTALADGGWLVTWSSSTEQGGDSYGIYQQRYSRAGSTVGDEIHVNSYTTDVQFDPSVTALADGGWVISWTSFGQDGDATGVVQQRYDHGGAAVGTEVAVNTYKTSYQSETSIVALSDGGWVVSWTSFGQDGSGDGVYQQRYGSDGVTIGGETRINVYTTNDQAYSSATALADGGWLVSWTSGGQDGNGLGVYRQRYDSDGTAVSGGRVNTYTTSQQYDSSVTGLADGGWLISWSSEAQDGDGFGIYQQQYDSAGGTIGSETRVNTFTSGNQTDSSVTGLADGGWLVCWTSADQDGSGTGVYQQRYDSEGAKVGSETRINAYTTGNQFEATAIARADGGWVVTWTSIGQDGDSYGVYQRAFAADVRGGALADRLSGTRWDETLIGFSGNDRLDGKGGNDILVGGYGDDIYVVNSAGDQVQETVSQGNDTILSSLSYSLASLASVEGLTLTGTKSVNATGNGVANVLTGNSGNNTLIGLGGKDVLNGGKGEDALTGGTLSDRFVFKTGYGDDRVTDFDAKTNDHDRLDLSGLTSIDNFADLKAHHLSQVGSAVLIDGTHGDSIKLLHVKLNTLDASDFLF